MIGLSDGQRMELWEWTVSKDWISKVTRDFWELSLISKFQYKLVSEEFEIHSVWQGQRINTRILLLTWHSWIWWTLLKGWITISHIYASFEIIILEYDEIFWKDESHIHASFEIMKKRCLCLLTFFEVFISSLVLDGLQLIL